MSESPPPLVAGNSPVHAQEGLTPDAIDRVLADFRSWLEEAAAAGRLPTDGDRPEADEPIDLHTLLGQFLALRHEVNLQTRAVRAQQEQNAETLRQLGQALEVLRSRTADPRPTDGAEDQQRALLKTLVDLYDALSLGAREAERVQQAVLVSLEAATGTDQEAAPPLSGLAKWLAGRAVRQYADRQQERERVAKEAAGRASEFVESMTTGYGMSLRRVERALERHRLEPIPTVGSAFDPERMEVVEVVSDSGRPAGEVVGEVRRGYVWNGRVFRCAQVRVAK
jgi:molecular chaperone GrpE